MTRWIQLIALGAMLGGCGVSEKKFQEEYGEKACECYPDGFKESCEIFVDALIAAAEADDSCEYDKAKAKECLDELDEECPGEDDFDASAETACDEVYTGCTVAGGEE